MRTMHQQLATSFRCARRTLPWFIELIRASLELSFRARINRLEGLERVPCPIGCPIARVLDSASEFAKRPEATVGSSSRRNTLPMTIQGAVATARSSLLSCHLEWQLCFRDTFCQRVHVTQLLDKGHHQADPLQVLGIITMQTSGVALEEPVGEVPDVVL